MAEPRDQLHERDPQLRERLQRALGDAFRVENEIGHGGMAHVFLATDTQLGRKIVFKVLPPELAAEVSVERFNREVHFAAQLNHPHIVPFLSAGSGDGLLYYTMPFVEGESLRSLLNREGQLSVDRAVQLAREVADALDFAHHRGIVHRDIKPENILLADDHAVVADFGIARAVSQSTGSATLTSSAITVGTAAYLSPEQASAEREIDGRSDIYSLSCVLYEMLTGEPPFTGASQQAIVAQRFMGPAPRASIRRNDVPQWLDDAIARGLAAAPSDRFPTGNDFRDALTPVSASSSSIAPPSATQRDEPLPRTKSLSHTVIAALGALLVLAIGAYFIRQIFQ